MPEESCLPILYSFRRCPYAMRARLGLRISGVELEHREIILRDKPAHMLEVSPKGTVPVLLLSDGSVLEESLDILNWALAQNDPDDWLSGKNDALIAQNDGKFKHSLDRYKYTNRYSEEGAEKAQHRGACLAILRELDQLLCEQAFLSGAKFGMSDAAILPFIRQFANTDREWFAAQELPKLQALLADFLNSEIFASIMKKWPLWEEPAQSDQASQHSS